MIRTALTLLLALCIFSGCAVVSTAGQPEQPASALPLTQPSEEAAGSAAESPSADIALLPPVPASDALAVAQAVSEPPTPPSYAPSPSADALPDVLDRVFTENDDFSGSVLIEKYGQVILCKSYGLADAEKSVLNTPETRLLVGSVTKQFTAMALMQLYEKGLVDIKSKLSYYLPDFSRGDEIKLKNLLTHTSGIADYMNGSPPLLARLPYDELSQRQIIDRVKTEPLKFDPGTKYSYSNTNYLILGYIIEQISGLSYGEYLEKYIFEPLGMANTGVFDINHPPAEMATGYMQAGKPVRYFKADGSIDTDSARFVMGSYGAGCLYSTVGDLYLWDRALSTEKLVSRRYLNMMFNPSVPVPGAVIECAYGYGWVIDNDPDVGTIVRHTGILSGFRAYNGRFADKGVIVIVLSNMKEYTGRDELIPGLKQVFAS